MRATTARLRYAVTTPRQGYHALAHMLFDNAERPDWHRHAACAPPGNEPSPDTCAACPVLDTCRTDTLTWEHRQIGATGRDTVTEYRAGMTAQERQDLLKNGTTTGAAPP